MSARGVAIAALVSLALAVGVGPAAGLGRAPRAPGVGPITARVSLAPDTARVGRPVRVAYDVIAPAGARVSFGTRPADDSLWTWRSWKPARAEDTPRGVRHRLEAIGLPFRTGKLTVPDPRYAVRKADGRALGGAFPRATLVVQSVLPPDQPAPDIRGLKPPFEPPWWARVPWWAVALVLAAVALLIWWLRRPKKVADERQAAVAEPTEPPHVEALAALDALVAEKLPERGQWLEHQTRLVAIVRRFLERRFGSPQPGYTTRELCLHLAWRGLPGADIERLRALLRVADLAKFARSDPGVEVARRHEAEARALILAWIEAPQAPESGESPAAAAGADQARAAGGA